MGVKPLKTQSRKIKHIVHIAREYGPVAGAGGIKDVTWGLCKASAEMGIAVHMFLPHYRKVDAYLTRQDLVTRDFCSFGVRMDYGHYVQHEEVLVSTCTLQPGLTLYFLKADPFRYLAEEAERRIPRYGIYQYTKDEAAALGKPQFTGMGYLDAFAQNVLLVKATLHTLGSVRFRPDLVHCHDGHAALFPLLAKASNEGYHPYLSHLPTLLTIHNAGKGYHQETRAFDYAQTICGIAGPAGKEIVEACALGGAFDPLLAGGIFGTAVNTVSENYARELRETGLDAKSGWLGHRFSGLGIHLNGITNGIDVDHYDPDCAASLGLPVGFSAEKEEWKGKERCKRQVIEALKEYKETKGVKKYGSLSYVEEHPLFTFVGRMTNEKGFDELYEAISALLLEDEKIQLLGLGSGNQDIMKKFKDLANKYEGKVCFMEGFGEHEANRVFASGDFFLIPSRFEPCGLTDYIAQLMGNIPIVHRVGGLVKTVDKKYGFSYLGGAEALQSTMKRALLAYRTPGKKRLRTIQRNAVKNVKKYFTWEKVLQKKYLPLYERVLKQAEPTLPY